MNHETKIRWGWLKFMYAYTLIGAGGFGLGILFLPRLTLSTFGFPQQDPIIFGTYGSVLVAFGILSIFGLRSPLKFVPVLMMQLLYKFIWLLSILFPLLIKNQVPGYAFMLVLIFISYILGDLIAIPFSFVFTGQEGK